MIDAPTHYARPAREGFFVHSGPLQLMKEYVLFSDHQPNLAHNSLIRSPAKKRNVNNKPKSTQAKNKGAPSSPDPKEPRTSLSASLLARIHAREGLRDPLSQEDGQDRSISVNQNSNTIGGNDGDGDKDGGSLVSIMRRHVAKRSLSLMAVSFPTGIGKTASC